LLFLRPSGSNLRFDPRPWSQRAKDEKDLSVVLRVKKACKTGYLV